MALMTASQSELVLGHDDTKSPTLSSNSISATPNTGTSSPAKQPPAQVMLPDQEGPCAANSMSLNAAMRADCRRCLYVHPIAWTPHHLELLGVYFDKARPLSCHDRGDSQADFDAKDEAKLATGHPWDTEISLSAIKCLTRLEIAMAILLKSFGLKCTRGHRDKIEMQFRGERVCYLRVQGVWATKAGDRMVICTNFNEICQVRRNWVYGVSRRPGRNHGAVLALKLSKFKALQPSRADRDPFIWGLLIAQAQAHKKLAPHAPRWKILVLAVPGPGAQQLYCYQGWVPAALLRKLDDPSAEVACPAVAIRVSTISLEAPRDAARCIWEVLHEAELV